MRIAALSLPLIYYLYTAADRHSSLWQLRWAFQSPPAEWAWRRALPLRSQLLLIGELSLLYKICTTPKCDNPPKEYELHVGRCAVRASDLTSHLPCNYWGRGDPLNGAEDDMPPSAGAQAPSWSDSPMTQWTRRQQQTAGHIALVFLFITQLEGWHRDSSVREIPRPNSEGPNSLLIHHLFISLSCVPAMGQTVFLNLDPGIPRWTWCIGTSPTGQHPLVAGDARSTNLWRTLWKEPFQRGWLTMKAKQTNKNYETPERKAGVVLEGNGPWGDGILKGWGIIAHLEMWEGPSGCMKRFLCCRDCDSGSRSLKNPHPKTHLLSHSYWF